MAQVEKVTDSQAVSKKRSRRRDRRREDGVVNAQETSFNLHEVPLCTSCKRPRCQNCLSGKTKAEVEEIIKNKLGRKEL